MQYDNNLKIARQKAKKTQEEVAEYMETNQVQISKWECGKQDITLHKALKLAELYNVSLDYLAARTNKKEINK